MENKTINDTLLSFLNTPLTSGDELFEKFKTLPNAIYKYGNSPLERYLYIPGKNKNRVLLMAHTDTVWDKNYKNKDFPLELSVTDGIITNGTGLAGIGADDRAGCAMLWLLKDSGHSLLLLDGEEHGHIGAKFLQTNKNLMKELNNHSFAVQLDLWGKDECKYHGIKNPKNFCKFISSLGYIDSETKAGGTDISYVCRKMAGVNVSVGYKNYHKKCEEISFEDFEHSYGKVLNILSYSNKKFRIPFSIILYRFIRHKIKIFVLAVYHTINKK